MGNFWSHDSTRNGASSSCSCSYSATDLAFHQIDVDRNIEIIWGVCTLQSARNNILFAFPRAGKYKGKTRGAFKGPGLELLSLRPVFGLFSCLWLAATPSFFFRFCFGFDSPTATPITTGALARPRCSYRAAAAPGLRTYGT